LGCKNKKFIAVPIWVWHRTSDLNFNKVEITGRMEVRPYSRADNERLSKLIDKIFSVSRGSRYCQWKYAENPAGKAISSIAQYEGRIIGQIGIIPTRFCVGGSEIIGVQEVDFLIEEEHRTLSVLYQLSKLRDRIYEKENVPFSYGLATPDTSVIAQKAANFVTVGPIPRLVKVMDVRPFFRKKIPLKILANLLSTITNRGLRSIYRVKEQVPVGTHVRVVNYFDERFDTFWKKIKNDYAIMTVKNSSFLNWRYIQPPNSKFQILSLEEKETGEVLGFAVLYCKHRHVPTGYIVDLVTPRNSGPQITQTLLDRAIFEFRKKKVVLILCWMFSHCHNYSALAKVGFRYRQEKHRDLVVKIYDNRNFEFLSDLLTKRQNWYITIGDSDFS